MSIPDRFPADTDPRALALVARAERDGTPPLVIVRPPGGCECILGRVYRVNGLDVLTGITVLKDVAAVVHGVERSVPRPEAYAVLLYDDPNALWLSLACPHGGSRQGELFGATLRRVRDGVAAATRYETTVRL